MDGWILTVDSLPVRGSDPGTPPAGRGGDHAAHMHAPDPTRTHCTQGPTDCKQSGMNKPSLLKQLASWGQTGCSRLPHFPKEMYSLFWISKHRFGHCRKTEKEQPNLKQLKKVKNGSFRECFCAFTFKCMYRWMDGWMDG